MKLLLDMNLSPLWAETLRSRGLAAVHWIEIGDPRAQDHVIMEWARANDGVVLTHDLDFGTLLALTHQVGPSVILVRTRDVTSQRLLDTIIGVVERHREHLQSGALITIDETQTRVRVLPLLR